MSGLVPAGETDYLAKAAALLDKAAESNEQNKFYVTRDTRREQIARQYALLGAIQRGVLPDAMAEQLFDSLSEGGAR